MTSPADTTPAVSYTVQITHGYDGDIEVDILDVSDANEDQRRVAAGLRRAADLIDANLFADHYRDSTNVIPMPGMAPPRPQQLEPLDDLCQGLAEALVFARSGQLRNIAATGMLVGGDRFTLINGDVTLNCHTMAGAITFLGHEYYAKVMEGDHDD